MEAMILAAGVGRRMRPLTDRIPKALVEVAGVPMLDRVARSLVETGADRLIINVHHHAREIEDHVARNGMFGVRVSFSREEKAPLETGGGLLAARSFFEQRDPFILHNVDVICGADLAAMYGAHLAAGTLATLAVNRRETSRPLLIDALGFRGLANRSTGWHAEARPAAGRTEEIGFAGIHVISPRIFDLITERGCFSIMQLYLRLAGEGHRIGVYDVSRSLWLEVGDPDRLARAESVLSELPPTG